MTDAVAISAIGVTGGIVTFVVKWFLARMDKKQAARALVTQNKIDGYHKEVDGMKTELVEAVRGRAQSEGEQKGAADNQAITDAKPQDQK